MRPAASSVSLAVLLAAAALPAQDPAPPVDVAGGILTPIRDEGPGAGIWGGGDDYKVSFHDGFVFVPYLGAAYAENLPIAWRTASVRIGSTELVTASPSGRRLADDRYVFDLGAVVETYELAIESVEQTFTIAAPPADLGTLTVTGVVTTALSASPLHAAHAALTFKGPAGEALVEYGAATAIDADGKTWPMSTTFDGERVVLELGAEHVADATFPLVVDPVLLSQSPTRRVGMVDIAYIDSDKWFACHTRIASSGDHDVYAYLYDGGWQNGRFWTGWTNANESSNHASCGRYKLTSDLNWQPVIAYERRFADRTEIRVRGRWTHDLTATPLLHLRSPEVAPTTDYDEEGLCLAYDKVFLSTATVRALVFHEDNLGWIARTPEFLVASPGVEVQPRVAPGFEVYWAENGSTTSWIRSRGVRSAYSAPRRFSLSSITDEWLQTTRYRFSQPRFSDDPDRGRPLTYVQSPRGIGFSALRAAAWDDASQTYVSRTLHSGRIYVNGDVVRLPLGANAIAAYVVETGALGREVRYDRIGSDAGYVSTLLSRTQNLPYSPAIAFMRDSSSQGGVVAGAYGTTASAHTVLGEILPLPVEAYRPRLHFSTRDCGGADELAGFGTPSLAGNLNYEVELTVPATLFSWLLVGTTRTTVPLDSLGMTGCYLHVDPIATILAQSHWAHLPLPSDGSTIGSNLYLQWLWEDGNANPLGVVTSSLMEIFVR